MKFQLLFSLFFAFLVNSINSQTYKLEYAQKLSSQFNFVEAYPVWEDLSNVFLKKQKGDWEYLRQAAKAAEKSEQYEKALYWIKILVDKNKALAKDYPSYFSLLCINKKHNLLEPAVQIALERFPLDSSILLWSKNTGKIIEANSKISEYKVENFRTQKRGEEFAAVPYKEGLILASNKRNTGFINRLYGRTNQHFLDLIFIPNPILNRDKDDLWKEIKRTNSHDGPISFSPDYSIAVITSNQKEIFKKDKIKYANLELTIYRSSENKWSATNLFKWNNPSYSSGHGVIDLLGDLYFASNMPGGFGESDLYKCKWNGTEFEAPINLGNTINTSKDELFPFLTDDGVIYFSSNGWPSQGGLDIFSSDLLTFQPENLGSPINTSADDFSFFLNTETDKGYLSSNRNDWKDNVFLISKSKRDIKPSISVIACDNTPLINVPIRITDLETSLSVTRITNSEGILNFKPRLNSSLSFYYGGDDKYAEDSIQFTYNEENDTEIKFQAKLKNQIVRINIVDENNEILPGVQLSCFKGGITKSKYLSNNSQGAIILTGQEFFSFDSIIGNLINFKDISIISDSEKDQCSDSIELTINMIKETGDEWINLGLILYDFDLFNLRPEGKLELDKLVSYMKNHPDLFVELQSHTDSRGSQIYNVWLAEQRSKSCVNYILSYGIPDAKIIPKGFGETRLKNNCKDFVTCNEDQHQENRRTELYIKLTRDETIDSSRVKLKVDNSSLENDSIYYRVQLISSAKKLSASSPFFKNLQVYEYKDDGLYKYCLSEKFKSFDSSKVKAMLMKSKGFPEAFIVVFKNDKRFK